MDIRIIWLLSMPENAADERTRLLNIARRLLVMERDTGDENFMVSVISAINHTIGLRHLGRLWLAWPM